MRFIKINHENKVVSIRHGKDILEGEIQSDTGELGQIMLEDGTFITPEPEPMKPQTSIKEHIYAENLYQTALLEMQMLGGI